MQTVYTKKSGKGKISILLILIFLTYPMREAFYFTIGILDFRWGELLLLFSPIFYFLGKWKTKGFRSHSVSNWILIFGLYSFLFDYICASKLDNDFAWKYLGRGCTMFFFIRYFEDRDLPFNIKWLIIAFKYFIVIQVIFTILQILGIDYKYGEFLSVESGFTQRISGTASEPGYLIPILAPSLYYFTANFKKYKIWCILSLTLVLMSRSSYGIFTLALVGIYLVFADGNVKKGIKRFSIIICSFLIALSVVSIFISGMNDQVNQMTNKLFAFTTQNENDMDYSGAERSENLYVALNAFKDCPKVNKILGNGLGATRIFCIQGVKIFQPAEEANNIYLSTLINQGIIGLCILIILLYKVLRIRGKSNEFKAFQIGTIVQLFQYMIVGNIWLYFLWFNIGLMIMLKKEESDGTLCLQ